MELKKYIPPAAASAVAFETAGMFLEKISRNMNIPAERREEAARLARLANGVALLKREGKTPAYFAGVL